MANPTDQKIILFAILNWGLGHASRSVPFIQYLQSLEYKIIICTDGQVVDFLENELDNIIYEFLPSYNIHYSSNSMGWNMVVQSPKIFRTYMSEKHVFNGLVNKYKPSACISDNRYGCITTKVPSFFLGHQWNILNSSFQIQIIASKINQFFIRKFDALLIPDIKNDGLSGKLTENITGISFYHLGFLSRFKRPSNGLKKEFDAIAILSGPEPKRTLIEKKLTNYFRAFAQNKYALIRGTKENPSGQIPSNTLVYNIADTSKLASLIQKSNLLFTRSGYSSMMDYLTLGVTSMILIPTKGQTEQEYLAHRLAEIHGIMFLDELALNEKTIQQLSELVISQNLTLGESLLKYKNSSHQLLEQTWQQIQKDFKI